MFQIVMVSTILIFVIRILDVDAVQLAEPGFINLFAVKLYFSVQT